MLPGEFQGYQKTMVPIDQQDIVLILEALRVSYHYVNTCISDIDNIKCIPNLYLLAQLKNHIIKDLDLIKKCQALLNEK